MLRCAVGGERWVVVGVVVMVGVEVVVLVGLAVVVAMAWFLFFSKVIFFFPSKIGGKNKMAPPPKNVARNAVPARPCTSPTRALPAAASLRPPSARR